MTSCDPPPSPPNGSVAASEGQTYSVGDPVMFQCDSGFSPADTMTAVCTVGGVWSPDPESLVCTESQSTLVTTAAPVTTDQGNYYKLVIPV